MVRRDLGGGGHAVGLRAANGLHRLACRDVEHVHGTAFVGGERHVPADHDALGHRRIAGEPELRRDLALVHLAGARERRLLAVHGDRPARDGAVLERAPHERRRDDRTAVVGEAGGARVGELAHLGQLAALRALGDRGEEADRHLGLGLGTLDERTEHCGRVDDRLGVGHGEDGAEAAGGGRPRAGRDRLLVLAAGRAQVDVRIDERGREHEAGCVDDAMAVRLDVRSELRDHAVVHAHVEHGVHAAGGIDDARAADDEVVLAERS